MKLQIRHYFRDLGNFYVTNFFHKFYSALESQYPECTFEIINDESYENFGYGSIYSCMNFSIINPSNEKYILISFFDNWKYHFMKHLGWKPSKMAQFFYPAGFNYIDYFNFKLIEKNNPDINCPSNIHNVYKPFFYGPYENGSLDLKDQLFKNRSIESTIPKLYFKGYMWDFRKQMTNNLKDESIIILDKNIDNNNLDYGDYLSELAGYRCALSLPGGTEICNRDIECFAIGVPVIRPYLDIQYPDPLIPNYHYISCYMDCKYWSGNPSYLDYNLFAVHLAHYWHKIKDNFEYLSFVSHNARNWFMKNCTLDNNIKYVLSQINMETLK